MARGGWNGLSLAVATRILSIFQVEICKNEEEGCIVAKHPTSQELIRRTSVTGCVEAVMKEWLVLKG